MTADTRADEGQADLFGEIIVDNFAGGGASTGIELAAGRTDEKNGRDAGC